MTTSASSESTSNAAIYDGLKQRTAASLVRLQNGVDSTSMLAGRRKDEYASLEPRRSPRFSMTAREQRPDL